MHRAVPSPLGSGKRNASPGADAQSEARRSDTVRSSSARTEGQRYAGVRSTLDRRAAAIRQHDRSAFLADVDPTTAAFRTRQARLFDALSGVRFASFSFDVDSVGRALPASARRPASAWSPATVVLRYRLAGFDAQPTAMSMHLTFVPRGQRWVLASDSDFDAAGPATSREIWDFGRVVEVRGSRSLVLGHPDRASMLGWLAGEADRDVPRVSAVWGTGWAGRVVVLLPSSTTELARILDRTPASLTRIAAVATAEVGGGEAPVGNRVLINPTTLASLGAIGRRVVMTHEITHVATRPATGPGAPSWLVEGFADYVGYRGTGVPVAAAADDLRRSVLAGRAPTRLPTDAEFNGTNARLSEVYESAWLACLLIADRAGEQGLVRAYRLAASAEQGAGAATLAAALRTVLGTSPTAFTAAWRASVRSRFS